MTDIKVTPADRAAAEGLHAISEVRNSIIEKAFARHRIGAQRPLLEALEKAEWLHRTGLFNATPEQIADVHASRHSAIKQAKGE